MARRRTLRRSDVSARHWLRILRQWAFVVLGGVIVLLGIAISPLPGPGGLPVIVVGLIVVLRNSYWAKRQFVRAQRQHPRMIFPLRRLLRRDPEVLPVAWQQWLRVERLVLPSRWRFSINIRRHLQGRKPIHRTK